MPDWQMLYDAAVLEVDPAKKRETIEEAERSMRLYLAHDSVAPTARKDCLQSLDGLDALKSESHSRNRSAFDSMLAL